MTLNNIGLFGLLGLIVQVGFEMIDSIAQAQGILMNTIQSKALIGIGWLVFPFYVIELGFHVTWIWSSLCFLNNQYRFNWRSTNFVGKASDLHEFLWRIGLSSRLSFLLLFNKHGTKHTVEWWFVYFWSVWIQSLVWSKI